VSTRPAIEVLLVGDAGDDLVHQVRYQLELDGDVVTCAGSTSCVKEACCAGVAPDAVVLVDRAIGDINEIRKELKQVSFQIPSVVVSSSEDPSVVQGYFRAGAEDVLLWVSESEYISRRLFDVIRRSYTRKEEAIRLNQIRKDVQAEMQRAEIRGEFRMLLSQELQIDQSLCVALEYISNRVTHGNALVLRPNGETPRVGAYINTDFDDYEFPAIARRLGKRIWPLAAKEKNLLRFTDTSDFAMANGLKEKIASCDIITAPCHHNGVCVAALVLFRHKSNPFTEEEGAMVSSILPELSSRIARLEVLSFHGDFFPRRPAA